MKKFVYSIVFISSIVFGQIEKNVGDFTKVSSFDKIDVLLIESNENKVILNGKEAEDIELINKNGELKIRMPLTKMFSGEDISVTVYFKNIVAVQANEGSRIASEDRIISSEFEIITKEGSEVKLNLETEILTARVANGSKINLVGKAKKQDVLVNSGGIYEAEKFKTSDTNITGNAGGEANIFATNIVNAKIRAGGTILIYGKPKQINKKIIAGGTIEEAK